VIGIIDTSDPSVASQALATYSQSVTTAIESGKQERHVIEWNGPEAEESWSRPLGRDGRTRQGVYCAG
jgi:hypothetical protein